MNKYFAPFGTVFLACGLQIAKAADVPVNDPGEYKSRLYSIQDNNYDPKTVLGRFYVVDVKTNTIENALEAPTVSPKCKLRDVIQKAAVPMQPQEAYYFLADKKFSGSLALFTASAKMSDEQRQQIELSDVANAAITAECQLKQAQVYDHALHLRGSRGKKVIWIYSALLSNLTNETFDKSQAQAGGSAGSWLSVGADFYKGSTKRSAKPLISVSGLVVDIPASGNAHTLTANKFKTLEDIGLAEAKPAYLPASK